MIKKDIPQNKPLKPRVIVNNVIVKPLLIPSQKVIVLENIGDSPTIDKIKETLSMKK